MAETGFGVHEVVSVRPDPAGAVAVLKRVTPGDGFTLGKVAHMLGTAAEPGVNAVVRNLAGQGDSVEAQFRGLTPEDLKPDARVIPWSVGTMELDAVGLEQITEVKPGVHPKGPGIGVPGWRDVFRNRLVWYQGGTFKSWTEDGTMLEHSCPEKYDPDIVFAQRPAIVSQNIALADYELTLEFDSFPERVEYIDPETDGGSSYDMMRITRRVLSETAGTRLINEMTWGEQYEFLRGRVAWLPDGCLLYRTAEDDGWLSAPACGHIHLNITLTMAGELPLETRLALYSTDYSLSFGEGTLKIESNWNPFKCNNELMFGYTTRMAVLEPTGLGLFVDDEGLIWVFGAPSCEPLHVTYARKPGTRLFTSGDLLAVTQPDDLDAVTEIYKFQGKPDA